MCELVILAAGLGSRLGDLTSSKPKCMVELFGRPIIEHTLGLVCECDLDPVSVVVGYKSEVLIEGLGKKGFKIKPVYNKEFSSTNMLYSLILALRNVKADVIVSYSDIVYNREVLELLVNAPYPFSVVSDLKWLDLWSKRMDSPLEDAESFEVEDGRLVSVGKKVKSVNDIHGQYIGLFKLSSKVRLEIIRLFDDLVEENGWGSVKEYYITDLMDEYIKRGGSIFPVNISGGWLEVDTRNDLEVYQTYRHGFEII